MEEPMKKLKRRLAVIMTAIIMAALLAPLSASPAYAATDEFEEFQGTRWVQDSTATINSGARFRSKSGAVAYCLDQGAAAPTGEYKSNSKGTSKLRAALYYGYPNVTDIEGYNLTADQARCATQLVVWALRGDVDLDGLHASSNVDNAPTSGNRVIAAAKALYAKAQDGFDPTEASITVPGSLAAVSYDDTYVRYGPFKASDATEVKVTLSGAPAGSYIGRANGNELSTVPTDTNFYVYIPRKAGKTSGTVKINIQAFYDVFSVLCYTKGGGYQDVVKATDPLDAKAEEDAELLPFSYLSITKTDERSGAVLPGASFKVQEWNGSAYVDTSIPVTWNAATQRYESGILIHNDTNKGRFRIVETASPPNYFNPTWQSAFTVAGYGATFGQAVTNRHYRNGYVEIVKADSEIARPGLSGAVFKIQEWNGSAYVDTSHAFTWIEASRRYRSPLLWENEVNGGRFRVVEISAPYAYLGSYTHDFQLAYNGAAAPYTITLTDTAPNTPVYLDVNILKHDRNTGEPAPQGDASLAGAKYGIYMNEDRTHPDGTAFRKGQLIQTAVTDKDGKASFMKLFPAQYYVQEIEPSEGYLLDQTKYPVDGRHDGAATSIHRNVTVTEQVKKQSFELIKGGTITDETEMELLHAGFKIYLISSLTKVKDGSLSPPSGAWTARDFRGYDFSVEATAKVDGVSTGEVFTDSKGKLTSPELPYGTYVIAETTVPTGRMAVHPFIVTVTEDRREPQPWRLFNDEEIQYYIKVIKRDSDTGENVLDKAAAYRIFDMDKGEYVTMKTTYPQTVYHGTEENPFRVGTSGALVTPQKLGYGHYRIDEIEAPTGYVLAGYEGTLRPGYEETGEYDASPTAPLYIDMDSQTPIYDSGAGEDVLEFVQYNAPQKGKLSVRKTGDVFKEVRRTAKGESVFAFKNVPLGGIEFDVIAKSDILTQDGHGTLLFTSGAIVETLTTDKKGKAATTAPLPIGEYTLHERKAPNGLIAGEDIDFEITATEQDIAFTYHAMDIDNVRQKLTAEVMKVDAETEKPLSGAKFGLYAASDIPIPKRGTTSAEPVTGGAMTTKAGITTDGSITSPGAVTGGAAGGKTIPAGTLIRTAWSEPDGVATFHDLLPGEYEVRELVAPVGYTLNTSFSAVFTLAYDVETRSERTTFSAVCANEKEPISGPPEPTPPAIEPEPPEPTPPAVEPETPEPTPPAVRTEPPKPTPAAVKPETPEKEKPAPDKGGGRHGAPKTGDSFPLKLMGTIAAIAAAALFFISRRYRKLK
jgi:TQXA domain-containing protein